MIRAIHGFAWLGGLLILLAATPAQAELTLCNRTSYRLDAAIGLEKRANVATRGWFRVDPGAMPPGGRRRARRRHGLSACAHAAGLRQRAHAAEPARPSCAFATAISRSPMRAAVRSASRRVSPPRSRPTRRKGRRSIWRRKPTTTTRRRGSPASSACWRSPAMTPIRSTASQGAKTQAALAKFLDRPQAAGRCARRSRIFSTPCSRPPPIRKAPAFPGATTPNTR